jgi:uncharacterized membrane protein YccC
VLRPADAPWAVRRAIWAVLAAGVAAAAGLSTGRLVDAGLAYFGVACAAAFVTSGVYRIRLVSALAQGVGAAVGIGLGVAVAGDVAAEICVAAVLALVSGMVGAIGPLMTSAALMAVIGLAFGEFAGVALPWWEQGGWYFAGTLVVLVLAIAAWPFRRDRLEWTAVATVFERCAELLEVTGEHTATARAALASAFASSRTAVFDYRLGDAGRLQPLRQAAARADQAAFGAAIFYAAGRQPRPGDIEELRRAATATRGRVVPIVPVDLAATSVEVQAVRPVGQRIGAAARLVIRRDAVIAGLRLALCMTVGTAVTCALHRESHSFWLPLTVAVAVRPEYASVFVRTVNRFAGTALGAVVAAIVLLALGSGWPVAVAAAVSLGFAVLAAPKLYGLSVVGVTCSALLSASIGSSDPVSPLVRLLDTGLGCAIAIVLGYLAWPGRRALPAAEALTAAAVAVTAYLDQALLPVDRRRDWVPRRDTAYQLAHRSRRTATEALREPGSSRGQAAGLLQGALRMEYLTDEVTAIADRVASTGERPPDADIARLTERIRSAGHLDR